MNNNQQPVLTLFAGVNGSGKSTLFELQKRKYHADLGVRICPDEILVENNGDWKDYKDVYASGRVAHGMIDECISKKQSFNWEVTLITNFVLKVLRRAKEAGFQIRLNFLLMDDVNVALQRIDNRVKNGGHGIPEDVVRSRFERQLINLETAMTMIDLSMFYYNDKYLEVIGYATIDQLLTFLDKDTAITRELRKKAKEASAKPVK